MEKIGIKHDTQTNLSAPDHQMKIMAWNCQGIEQSLTVWAMKSLIQTQNLDIIFLSETKYIGSEFRKKKITT